MFEDKTKVLIITGILSPMHDWRKTNQMLRKSLEVSGHFIVKICEEFRGMTAESLQDYDAVLINYDGMENFSRDADDAARKVIPLGETAEKALCEFVSSGKGIMFFHSSTIAKDAFSKDYTDMIGVTSSDQYERYRDTGYIIDMAQDHPITEGVEPHWQLCDDDFFNSIEAEPGTKVLATIYDPANKRDVPMMWCKEYGKGRVFGCALGHQQDTLRRLDFCRLLLRGMDWAAHGTITVPMPTRDINDDWMRSWPWYYSSPIGRLY